MEEKLQHDPRTKQQIKDMLYAFLYAPVEREFKHRLDKIILQNTNLLGVSHTSFVYKGEYYCTDQSRPPRKMNRLVSQMIPVMDLYLQELKQLNNTEIPYVVGFINQVLNSSNDLHDYLKILPISIHQPIDAFIATCPCRARSLTPEIIKELQDNNAKPIQLIKERLVINLLI